MEKKKIKSYKITLLEEKKDKQFNFFEKKLISLPSITLKLAMGRQVYKKQEA